MPGRGLSRATRRRSRGAAGGDGRAALGALLPVRRRAGPGTVAVAAAGASTLVELLQYARALGRVSSVDDVLLNTLGAVLAAQPSRPWWRSRSGDDDTVAAPVR